MAVEAAHLITRLETVGARESIGAVERMGRAVDALKGNIAAGFAFAAGFAAFNAGLGAIKSGLEAVIGATFEFNSRLQQSTIAFETMLGGVQQATVFMGELRQLAIDSAFSLPQVQQGAQRLLAMGFEVSRIPPLLKDIGAASIGLNAGNEGISRMVRALGQMRSVGKVMAEDMNQLTDLSVPAWDILAKSIGRTVAETRKLGEQGRISAETFIAAFQQWSQGEFGGIIERYTQTWEGATSKIKDLAGQMVGGAFQPLFEWATKLAVQFGTWLESPQAARWAAAITAAVEMAVNALKSLWAFVQPVRDALSGLFDGFADLMGIPKAQAGVKKAAEPLGKAVAEGMKLGITEGNPLDAAIKAMQGPLGHLRIAIGDIKDAYDAAKSAATSGGAAIERALAAGVREAAVLSLQTADIKDHYQGLIDPLKEQAAALAPIVDFQAQIRDLALDTEASVLREAQQRERILNAGRDTITYAGRRIRGRPQSEVQDELRLLDIQIEQRKTKGQQQLADIQRGIVLAPILAGIAALEAAQKAHLAPIEAQEKALARSNTLLQFQQQDIAAIGKAWDDAAAAHAAPLGAQLKAHERQLALLQLEKQAVADIGTLATNAGQAVASVVAPLTGDADSGAGEFGGRVFDFEAVKKRGIEIGKALLAGLGEQFGKIPGAIGEAFGKVPDLLTQAYKAAWDWTPLWVAIYDLKKAITGAISPEGLKAWENFRDGFLSAVDKKIQELRPAIRTMTFNISKWLTESLPDIVRLFLWGFKELATLHITQQRWFSQIGTDIVVEIAKGVWAGLPVMLTAFRDMFLQAAKDAWNAMPTFGLPNGAALPAPGLSALPPPAPSAATDAGRAAEASINVSVGQIVLKPEMTDAERQAAEKRIGAEIMRQILAAQQAAA